MISPGQWSLCAAVKVCPIVKSVMYFHPIVEVTYERDDKQSVIHFSFLCPYSLRGDTIYCRVSVSGEEVLWEIDLSKLYETSLSLSETRLFYKFITPTN